MIAAGEKIPHFEKPNQEGTPSTFDSLKGHRGMVLYFYPKDNTPGCTTEAQEFRDQLPAFEALGLSVVGVSKDSLRSHTNFIAKHELPFTLLSDDDPEAEMCQSFEVWQEKKNYGKVYMGIVRTTYLIDSEGVVLKGYPKVRVKEHVATVLADATALLHG